MNELFKIDMDKREIVLNYKHYNVNIDVLNFIVDLLKQLEAYKNMRKEAYNTLTKSKEYVMALAMELNEKQSVLIQLANILNKVGEDNEFIINNHKWTIEERPEEDLLEEYHKRSPEAYSCLGLTFYKEHKIWLNEDLCRDEKIRTLKHELTHCYIWENGFYNVDFNNEELVCDFVASIYEFIKSVLED